MAEASPGPRTEKGLECLVLCTAGGAATCGLALPESGRVPVQEEVRAGWLCPHTSPQLPLPRVHPYSHNDSQTCCAPRLVR